MIWLLISPSSVVWPSVRSYSLSSSSLRSFTAANVRNLQRKTKILFDLWSSIGVLVPCHLLATIIITTWRFWPALGDWQCSNYSRKKNHSLMTIRRWISMNYSTRKQCGSKTSRYIRMVVVPPATPARVPVRKSSTDTLPINGSSKCVCVSIPPESGMDFRIKRILSLYDLAWRVCLLHRLLLFHWEQPDWDQAVYAKK